MTAVKGSPDAGPDAHAMAQRRLHDAAPDLLEALQRTLKFIRLGNHPNAGDMLDQAEAAIAKATNPVTTAVASGRAPTMEEVAETLAESDQTAAERG